MRGSAPTMFDFETEPQRAPSHISHNKLWPNTIRPHKNHSVFTTSMRMTAADFKKQFGSSVGNQIVNESAMKPQIRLPKNTGPNKTEAEWMRICQSKNIDSVVLYEPWSLKLPSGSKYTPDVVVIDGANQDGRAMITCYEVKGAHIHQSGGRSILAFKEARAAYPWMRFVFAQKRKDGWATSE